MRLHVSLNQVVVVEFEREANTHATEHSSQQLSLQARNNGQEQDRMR